MSYTKIRNAILTSILLLTLVPAVATAQQTEEQKLLTLINSYRKSNGLTELQSSPMLTKAAAAHSQDMAQNNYFSHTSKSGQSPFDRMSAAGYNYNTYRGENIAAGNSSAERTFEQWKNSAPHNANMLSKNYKAIGIGLGYNNSSTYKYYWTTKFGGVVDGKESAKQPEAPTPKKRTSRLKPVSLYR